MKRAATYGLLAWAVSLLIGLVILPRISRSVQLDAAGRAWAPVALVVFGLPAFFWGWYRDSRLKIKPEPEIEAPAADP